MAKAITKADPYEHHRDEVAAIIGDEQYLFDSVEEALTLYRPAWEDEGLGKRLSEDRELSRLLLSQKIKERAKVRRNVVNAANKGNDKAAKLALNTLSETTEWAKLNGKPWGSLALIGDGNDDGRVAVNTLATVSNAELTAEVNRRKKQARALLADTTATEAHTEETEQDEKIELDV
jgi:hypothetical protein